jgi:hypothetical protein
VGTNTQSTIAPASDTARDNVTPEDGLAPLLCPWEDRRLRRHRLKMLAAAPECDRESLALTLGFNFVDAPPGRVREAFRLLRDRLPDDYWLSRPNDQPPQIALVELAEKHWGRVGGYVGFRPHRMRVDLLGAPVTKARLIQQAIRDSWPDALPVALINTWSSWAALEPLGKATGDHFDQLDLDEAAVVTWWWD